jgi:hypothetical protein
LYSNGQATISFDGQPCLTIRDAIVSVGNRDVRIGEGPVTVFVQKNGTVESVELPKP